MRILKNMLIAFMALVVILALGKNMIAKVAVTGGVKMVTGLDVSLPSMQVGLLKPVISIKGLQVMNPSGYQDKTMLSLPELYVNYDLASFFKGKAHLRELRLNMDEFAVIKRADGQVNIKQIKALQQQPSNKAQPSSASKTGASSPELQIDALELHIGRVVFKDYSRSPVYIQEFPVNINERHEHIANTYALAGLIVTRALLRTSVAKLANIDLASLQAGVAEAMKQSAAIVTQGLDTAQQTGQQVLKNTKDIISQPGQVADEMKNTGKEALGAAKDTTEAVKRLFKNQ